MSANPNVLVIGFDPHAIPGVDAALVDAAIAIGQKRFESHGIPADLCMIKPDDSADAVIVAHLTSKEYACVRSAAASASPTPDEAVTLLERVIHLGRNHAPGAAIAFNTNPTTSLGAALRWLP
ncbi:MAG TPA: hypothetical protein VFK02_28740 [Kofleriaceae bacterium]|nr:hypothetical protein [Kofleriaceae bacterium]